MIMTLVPAPPLLAVEEGASGAATAAQTCRRAGRLPRTREEVRAWRRGALAAGITTR